MTDLSAIGPKELLALICYPAVLTSQEQNLRGGLRGGGMEGEG